MLDSEGPLMSLCSAFWKPRTWSEWSCVMTNLSFLNLTVVGKTAGHGEWSHVQDCGTGKAAHAEEQGAGCCSGKCDGGSCPRWALWGTSSGFIPVDRTRIWSWASQVALVVKNTPANAGDMGTILGLERSPGGGNGNPLHYSCLENPMGWEPGGLQSTGLQRVAYDWSDLARTHTWSWQWDA